MAWVDQDVVGETEVAQGGHAAQELRPQQEAVVGLGLHDVAQAHELGRPANGSSWARRSGACRSTQPTTPRDERVPIGQLEQPARLLQGLARLHGHAGVEAGGAQLGLEVGGQEVAPEGGHGASIHSYSTGS